MSLAVRHTDGYKAFVNRESVRLYSRAGAPKGSVADAKRTPYSRRERMPSEGQYIGTEVGWFLPACNLAVDCVPGDFIADSNGVAYTVLSVGPPGVFDGCWIANCVSLMVLGHSIVWHVPVQQDDLFASPLTDQSGTLSPMPCAIQEVACEEILFQGASHGFRRTYAIWVLGDILLQLGTIGIDDTGLQYAVTAVDTRNRLDELLRVTAVREPG